MDTTSIFKIKPGDKVTWNDEYVYDNASRSVRDLKRASGRGPFLVGEDLGDGMFLMTVDPYKEAEPWRGNFFVGVPTESVSYTRWFIDSFLLNKAPSQQ